MKNKKKQGKSQIFYWMKYKGCYYEENKKKAKKSRQIRKKDKEIQRNTMQKNQKEIKKKEGIQRFMMKECSTCWNDSESGVR